MSAEYDPIRVLVCSHTPEKLGELQSIVRGSRDLELAGSSLGHKRLDALVESALPDVVLHESAAANLEDILEFEPRDPAPPTILLVSERQAADALACMRSAEASVRCVLPAWSSEWEIRAAIQAVAEGLMVLHPTFVDRIPGIAGPSTPAHSAPAVTQPLSHREREILNLLAAGLGNKQIAAQLHISEHTVKFHVSSIFNKLNASSRAEAVAIGARHGLILF